MRYGEEKRSRADARQRLLAALILGCLGAIFTSTLCGGYLHGLWHAVVSSEESPLIKTVMKVWADLWVVLIAFRTLLWIRYRPYPEIPSDEAPFLTVVIPVYNEGPSVLQSIQSIGRARYPRGRLEVIVIDDGSVDDSWEHIRRGAREYPELVRPIRLTTNQGKREALARGFEAARGEIVATIDSDSAVDPDTLLRIVSPFRNPRIGAVAGKILARNRASGILPRMIHAYFFRAFDLVRAAQSGYRTVYCCPGALSAYRLSPVLAVLEEWRNLRFLGTSLRHGEDRALTTLVLAQGYHSVYQRSALVSTQVPDTISQLCRMYLRWERSLVCEEIRLISILRNRPLKFRLITIFDLIMTDLQYLINYGTLISLAVIAPQEPVIFARLLLAVLVAAVVNLLYFLYLDRTWRGVWEGLYGILYDFFAFLCLWWILPYAILTMRDQRWGTR